MHRRDPASVYAPSKDSEGEAVPQNASDEEEKTVPRRSLGLSNRKFSQQVSVEKRRSSLNSQTSLCYVPELIEESITLHVMVIGSNADQRTQMIDIVCEQCQGECPSPTSPATSSRGTSNRYRGRGVPAASAPDAVEVEMPGRTAFISTSGSRFSGNSSNQSMRSCATEQQHARVNFEESRVSFFDDFPQMGSRVQAQSTAFLFLFSAGDHSSLTSLETPLAQLISSKELSPLKVLLGTFPNTSKQVACSKEEIMSFRSQHKLSHYFELHGEVVAKSDHMEGSMKAHSDFEDEVCIVLKDVVHLMVQRLQRGGGSKESGSEHNVAEMAEGSRQGSDTSVPRPRSPSKFRKEILLRSEKLTQVCVVS